MRIIMFLSTLAMICMFLFLDVPSIWNRYSHEKAMLIISIGILLFIYLSISVGYSLLTQKVNLVIKNKKIFLKNIFSIKTTSITDKIRGYRISAYNTLTTTESIAGYFKTADV